MTRAVVLGDMHAHPDFDIKRFRVAGEWAAAQNPTHVISIGDFSDCSALNTHGTLLEDGSREILDDVEVTRQALSEFMAPFYRRKKKLPKFVITLGNHEWRFERFLKDNPKVRGLIGKHLLGFEAFGWEQYDFKRSFNLEGWKFVHHLGTQNGSAAKVNSPTNGAKSVGRSCVVGHSHVHSLIEHPFEDDSGKGYYIHGLDVGCLIHKDMGYMEHWSCDTAFKYWRGIHLIDNMQNGDGDISWVRASTLGV